MRNSKHWRKRTLESEKTKIAQLIKEDVMEKLFEDPAVLRGIEELVQAYRKLGVMPKFPRTRTHKIMRLERKIRRMQKGTYRQRNRDG